MTSNRYFGPWFPDTWFGPWFPGYQSQSLFTGYGPGGAATFCTDLESGFKVTLDWSTDVEKAYSGKEKRVAPRDAPKQRFDGATLLMGDDPATVRGQLGARMALGSPFLLGLQYEGLTLVQDSSGDIVYVNPAMVPWCDWLVEGQRVICKKDDDENPQSFEGVIQDVDAVTGAVTLDGPPTGAGAKFCELMPLWAVYFEPQQTFDRYPVNVEQWNITARNAIFDFAPPRGTLDLEAITGDANLHGALLKLRKPGYGDVLVEFNGHGGGTIPTTGRLDEAGPTDVFWFRPAVTTLADLANACILNSQNFILRGNYNPAAVLNNFAPDDDFSAAISNTILVGAVGNGAVLTSYDGKSVWDWPIVVDTSGQDSIQSMINIFDFGGVPVVVGTTDVSDYGRHLMIRSGRRQDWQWLKKFLWSIRGSQKAFWLPTWRHDLRWQSGAGTSIVVTGDVSSWYPRQRNRLMVVETGGVVVYTQILAAVYNADGTTTLTLADAVDNISMISWLELSRFEQPTFDIYWTNNIFSMASTARVVQQ